jgi:hypothetical protein
MSENEFADFLGDCGAAGFASEDDFTLGESVVGRLLDPFFEFPD